MPLKNDSLSILIIFAIFLFPAIDYKYYFIFVLGCSAINIAYARYAIYNIDAFNMVMVFAVICLFPKLLFYQSADDVKEALKILLFAIVAFVAQIRISYSKLKLIIIYVLMVDGVFSILQWMKYDALGFQLLEKLIHPEHHIEGSLLLNSTRALGIFTDTAEHGSVIFIFYLFLLSDILMNKVNRLAILGIFAALLIITLTQSKTMALVCLLSVPVLIIALLRSGQDGVRYIIIMVVIFLIAMYYKEFNLEDFEQYEKILDNGELSSFDARVLIWISILDNFSSENILLIIFGPGRGSLNEGRIYSSVFDSDYIYLLNTYGILGSVFVLYGVYCTTSKIQMIVSRYSLWQIMVVVFWPVIATSIDFISSLKVLAILGLIINISTKKLDIIE